MRITVFTGNQPRHIALLEALAEIAERVYAVMECTTVFPGVMPDFFRKSPVMQDYFSRVLEAERRLFGAPRPLPRRVRALPLRMGDASSLDVKLLRKPLRSDVFIVFGASYLRGPLCEALVERRAINIHMGVSPYYRGSSTNFWAMYDRRPDLVGATIHLLTKGLDSGPILMHALPRAQAYEPFELGMCAVRAAQQTLVRALRRGDLGAAAAVPQEVSRQLRYTRNTDFTDDVASEYLGRLPAPQEIAAALEQRDMSLFVRPSV